MAITKQMQTMPAAILEKTWRINFELPANSPPSIQIFREDVPVDDAGTPVGKSSQNYAPIHRTLEQVGAEVVTLGDGSEMTFEDIVEALSILGDKWAQEDAQEDQDAA